MSLIFGQSHGMPVLWSWIAALLTIVLGLNLPILRANGYRLVRD